jgi:hypothetical protein
MSPGKRKKSSKHRHDKHREEKTEVSPPKSQSEAPTIQEGPDYAQIAPRLSETPKRWDVMTVATIVLAIATAASAAFLWIQLQDSRENFTKDQRPYIWSSKVIDARPPSKPWVPWTGVLYYNNYGKAPAIRVRSSAKLNRGLFMDKWVDEFFAKADKEQPEDAGSEDIIPPGQGFDPYKNMIVEGIFWTDDELRLATEQDGFWVAVAHFQYYDAAGNFHYSDMCWMGMKSGIVATCLHHNEIH